MKEIETERYEIRIPKIEDAEEIYEKWGTDTMGRAHVRTPVTEAYRMPSSA